MVDVVWCVWYYMFKSLLGISVVNGRTCGYRYCSRTEQWIKSILYMYDICGYFVVVLSSRNLRVSPAKMSTSIYGYL